jgi:hypothetical protein
MAGLDFAFTVDAFHARATPGHRERLRGQTRLTGLINAGAAFRRGVVPAAAKNNEPVRTDPAMKGYRDLFEREFAGESRFYDITGPGLPLGLKSLTLDEAVAVLRGGEGHGMPPGLPEKPGGGGGEKERRPPGEAWPPGGAALAMGNFIRRERDALVTLRGILTGSVPATETQLEACLDEAGYLWAWFPECAGAEGRRPGVGDISFLKRVRVEIEPFLKLWDLALGEIENT